MSTTVARFLSLGILALLLAGWALVLRPASLGGPVSYVIIQGSSMLPAYASGDLVIVRSAAAYQAGDVVAYRVPDGDIGEGRIVIHCIVGGDEDGFTLEGDNNSAPDPWLPRDGDIVGEAWVAVPTLGRVLAFLHQPALLAALAAVVVALIVAGNPQRAPAVATRRGLP